MAESRQVMLNTDLPAVIAIEQAANQFPWSAQNFRDCLQSGYQNYVWRQRAQIVGFSITQTVLDELHILNICVSPAHQGNGIGRCLLEAIIAQAAEQSATLIVLEVRASNQRAQQLYFSCGFNEMATRRNYYPTQHGREDALLLGLSLSLREEGWFNG
ncbi:Ribosomal-protein-S18p-alanine acetyltransferase [Methylophaga frappieri]|uniref:[Ribosomal protein bS18]-alanine N-acetyltransferase n=1 Tax=Methylophaga frappieri (strain ATCC BAA-2434 / DSM 25690 / JAM7) TaxID=754477 RepID=I1YLI6_METFJ|nr:ribosomal protein S18-alanine N-acetyltransferase [Methylophaga frappieri]AFJ03779.1 Ribosomal-protein-S18p-alanine acetyltransferase [Methylophaga frappieri]